MKPQKLQQIQMDHAFKILSLSYGAKARELSNKEASRFLLKMGFEIVKLPGRTIATRLPDSIVETLDELAEKEGVSRAALVRDILFKTANKKQKIL